MYYVRLCIYDMCEYIYIYTYIYRYYIYAHVIQIDTQI